jgi:hypothetical protein
MVGREGRDVHCKGGDDGVGVGRDGNEASPMKGVIEVIAIGWGMVVDAVGPDRKVVDGVEVVSGIVGGQGGKGGSTKIAFRKNCAFERDKGKYFGEFGLA